MKKILIITYTHSNGGGAENVLTTFVNNLDSDKYRVTIQEIDYFGVKVESLNNNILRKRVPLNNTTRKDLFNEINRYFLINNPKILKSIFNWYDYDIVIAWNYQLPSFALNAFDNEFTISHFHSDIYDLDISKYPEQKKNYEMQVEVWNKVDRITTISNRSKQSLLDIFPQFSNKVSFLHNGFDINNIINKSLLKEEKEFLFNEKCLRLISIGRLDKNKNFSLVLKAISILKRKCINVDYLLLGIGDQLTLLQDEAKELGIADNVHFLGYIQNPYPYIKKSDVLCLSSFSEGWPTVIVEAMCLGKTFITTPVSGASEELSNNESCGLVSGWNPEEYAQRIEKLYQEKELRNQLGKNGKELIKKYSIESSLKEFEMIISNDIYKNNVKEQSKTIILNILKYIIFFSSGIINFKGRINNWKIKTDNKLFNMIKIVITIIEIPLLFIPKCIIVLFYFYNARKTK